MQSGVSMGTDASNAKKSSGWRNNPCIPPRSAITSPVSIDNLNGEVFLCLDGYVPTTARGNLHGMW